ncbi:MAG: thiamine-phosphate kinase [Propionibacteriaceae bacterium]
MANLPFSPQQTLAEVGEFQLLKVLLPTLPASSAVLVGPGDDSAVVSFHGPVVMSTDALVEGVHFRTDWSSAHDIGRKSVAVNVTDVEAMGARPVCIVMTFSAPGTIEANWVAEFFRGVVDECHKAGITLAGGDITRSRDITISVTILGDADTVPVVQRAGAHVGDTVALCGRQGYAAAGLAVLMRGFRSPRVVVDAQRCPEPPYGAGRTAALAGATAMIDVSDGLLADLGHICEHSDVTADIRRDVFVIPEALHAVGQATGKHPLQFILAGGEDQALIATFPPEKVPTGWLVIGQIVAEGGQTVLVDGQPWDGARGWDHYQ